MRYDKKIKKIIEEINKDTKDYLDYINNLNECAFTDRKIENIIKKAKELDRYYNDNFEKATNNDLNVNINKKIIEKLYDFWKQTDDDKDKLLKEIETNVNNGKEGAEVLLDWCRCDYDYCRNTYMEIHSLNEYEMEKIMEEHFGDYTFMYEEVPYASELEEIWDLCNYYLDYCNEKNELNLNRLLSYIYM